MEVRLVVVALKPAIKNYEAGLSIGDFHKKLQLPGCEYFSENPFKVRTQAQVIGILGAVTYCSDG